MFAVRSAAVLGLVDHLDRATVLALAAGRIRDLAEDAAARAVDEGGSYGEVGRAVRISRAAPTAASATCGLSTPRSPDGQPDE